MARYVNFTNGYGLFTTPLNLTTYRMVWKVQVENTGTQVIASTTGSLNSFHAFRDTNAFGVNDSISGSTVDFAFNGTNVEPMTGEVKTIEVHVVSATETNVTVTNDANANTQTQTTSTDMSGADFGEIFRRGDSLVTTAGRFYSLDIYNDAGTLIHSYVAPASGTTITDTTGSNDITLAGTYTLEDDAPVSGTISITDQPVSFYQRGIDGIRTVAFSGTYTGTPTTLQYRVVDLGTSGEVVTWTTFDASPSGGAFSGTVDLQGRFNDMRIEARFSNDTGISSAQTTGFKIGDNILIMGQSLAVDMRTDGAVSNIANYSYATSTGTFSTGSTTGVGQAEIARNIIDSEGIPVRIINTAVGSTPLTVEAGEALYWNDPTGSLWTNTVSGVNTATEGQNELAFIWWHQGNNDATTGVTQTQYRTALDEFYTRVRATFTGEGSATLPIFHSTLGRDLRGTPDDAVFDGIRQALVSKANEDANTYAINTYTFEMPDNVHFSESAYIELGKRITAQYYFVKGDLSVDAPILSSVQEGDTSTQIDLIFDSTIQNDGAYATEGVRVTDDTGDLTVSSFAYKNSTTATITVSTAPTGTVRVWLSYGAGDTINTLVYPRSTAVTIPNTVTTTAFDALPFFAQEFSALTSVTFSISGMPNGTYLTRVFDNSNNIIFNNTLAFTSGSATLSNLSLTAGASVEGFVIDNEATHVNGAVITGTTA